MGICQQQQIQLKKKQNTGKILIMMLVPKEVSDLLSALQVCVKTRIGQGIYTISAVATYVTDLSHMWHQV